MYPIRVKSVFNSKIDKMKQAVLYLTNKSNEWTLSAFHALEQSLQGMADVYFAYHQQGDVLPVSLQNIENLFVFTSDVLNELGYTPIEKVSWFLVVIISLS